MAKDSYRIVGSGATPVEADKSIATEQKKLAKTIEGDLPSSKEAYSAVFELKKGINPSEVDATRFETSGSNWQDIDEKFQRVKDGGQYNGRYTVERFFDLSAVQLKATRGEKRSPAGYESSRPGSLSGLERFRA